MPEGPEVFALAYALRKYGFNQYHSYGKHLFTGNEDWSFGLNGRVHLLRDGILSKISEGYIIGANKPCSSYENFISLLGMSWINEDTLFNDFTIMIETWKTSKKTLATLILDQSYISGIGVAWGSEILSMANLDPSKKACDQCLNCLPTILLSLGTTIRKQYTDYIDHLSKDELYDFINEWFHNLYRVRTMNVYKKGKKIVVGNRTWYHP
jgi:formamidopyrimidine-DNA glycosylase